MVALLMIAISVVISNRVLNRLEETQERNLRELSSAYLDGLSASLVPSVVREDVWEVFDALDRSRELYRGLSVLWVVVTKADNEVIAATSPEEFPPLSVFPATTARLFSEPQGVTIDEANRQARMMRSLTNQNRETGKIYAVADISLLMQERANALHELIFTNLVLTLFLVAFGYYFMRRMLRPVTLLTEHLTRSSTGKMDPIPGEVLQNQSKEFRELFVRYNELTVTVNERELLAAELAEEEKLASVGRLASGMAHEINNPLGGMFNALDSLRRHGARDDVRTTSIRLLEQGLSGIRDLVRSTLTTYRSDQRARDLSATDLDDLRLLVKPEARSRKVRLDWKVELIAPVQVPAVPVRDAILNLLLNACHSCREGGVVRLHAFVDEGNFIAEVSDEGPGLQPHVREYLERQGAGSTPLDRRSGLGLWIVKRHCDELSARLVVVRSGSSGTSLRFRVPLAGKLEHAA
jgi:signal transduction histidine kinase